MARSKDWLDCGRQLAKQVLVTFKCNPLSRENIKGTGSIFRWAQIVSGAAEKLKCKHSWKFGLDLFPKWKFPYCSRVVLKASSLVTGANMSIHFLPIHSNLNWGGKSFQIHCHL